MTYFVSSVNVIFWSPEKVKVTKASSVDNPEISTLSDVAKTSPVGRLSVPKAVA